MDSKRVKAVLNESPCVRPEIQETIVVPKEVYDWKASATGVSRAMAVQAQNRQRFLDAFARGLAVVGFQVDQHGNGAFELARLENSGAL
jgi:hypothetical protein